MASPPRKSTLSLTKASKNPSPNKSIDIRNNFSGAKDQHNQFINISPTTILIDQRIFLDKPKQVLNILCENYLNRFGILHTHKIQPAILTHSLLKKCNAGSRIIKNLTSNTFKFLSHMCERYLVDDFMTTLPMINMIILVPPKLLSKKWNFLSIVSYCVAMDMLNVLDRSITHSMESRLLILPVI